MRKNGRQQHRMALVVNEGRKWTHVIFMEYPVQVEKVINNEAQRCLGTCSQWLRFGMAESQTHQRIFSQHCGVTHEQNK
mgnify:CR=1 FL=1